MTTLKKTHKLDLVGIDGVTDLSEEKAASYCGGVSATPRFVPSNDIGGPGADLVLFEGAFDGGRLEINAEVGETVSLTSTPLNNEITSAIASNGVWELHEFYNEDVGPEGRSAIVGRPGWESENFFNTDNGAFNDILSSATRIA